LAEAEAQEALDKFSRALSRLDTPVAASTDIRAD